jgi:hypothetical protein
MSAVHARLHASLRREFGLISGVISQYMPPQYVWDDTKQFNRQQDFDGRVDILPVSDPNASTQAQKIIQMQAVQQQVAANPELYNMKEVHRAGLQAIGIKNDERLLPLDKPPPRMDPVQENMAILTGQPVKVFPDQDHSAHIQVHLSMATDPKILEMLKASPSAAKLQGQMEAHLGEHLAHQYHAEMAQMMGVDLPPLGEEQPPQIEASLSRALADASIRLKDMHVAEAQQKQAEQIAADPVFQLREREVAVKERKQAADEQKAKIETALEVSEKAADEKLAYAKIDSQERQTAANVGANLVTFGAQLEADERESGVELAVKVADMIDNKMTAKREETRNVQKQIEESNEAFRERAHDAEQRQLDREAKKSIAAKKPAAPK